MRKLMVVFLALAACSRSSDEAGIVLNVDTEVSADRNLIDQLSVTVDGQRQDWILKQPLPGSLGITTSPGSRLVVVVGLAAGAPRGSWSGTVVATKGSVVVRDVHLSSLPVNQSDAGRDLGSRDAGDADAVRDGGAIQDGSGSRNDGAGDAGDGRAWTDSRDGGGDAGRDSADSRGIDASDAGVRDVSSDVPSDLPAAGDDGPAFDAAAVLRLTGAYAVTSQFQLKATAAAPGPLADAIGVMHGLASDPGGTILDYAGKAGVPGLSTLQSALPDVLMNRLSGWITSYIKTASIAGVTPYDQLVTLDNLVQALLLEWAMRSRLTLPANGSGTHAPLALVFTQSAAIPLEPTAAVTAGTGVVATIAWSSAVDSVATVTVGDHTMGLPFGRYALQALNMILLDQYGSANLAAYLSKAVGCEGMANSVASQCVSIACVGHKSELQSVCEGGLAAAAGSLEDQILGLDFKAIHFIRGTASAVGVAVSRVQDATSLQDGTWSVTVDLGSGAQPAAATFSATAETTAP